MAETAGVNHTGHQTPTVVAVCRAWAIAGGVFWAAARKLRARVNDAERRRLMIGGERDASVIRAAN
jgi:hypothetical protein